MVGLISDPQDKTTVKVITSITADTRHTPYEAHLRIDGPNAENLNISTSGGDGEDDIRPSSKQSSKKSGQLFTTSTMLQPRSRPSGRQDRTDGRGQSSWRSKASLS